MANTATFDAKFKEALPLYEKLKSEWNRKPPNVGKTDELLASLKVFLFSPSISINKSTFLVFRIYLPMVDFIHLIQAKMYVVYILHVGFFLDISHL